MKARFGVSSIGCNGKALFSIVAVGCTEKALFGVGGRLHWAIRLGLGMVSTLKQATTRLGLETVSALKQTMPRCHWIYGLHYKCLICVKTSKVN